MSHLDEAAKAKLFNLMWNLHGRTARNELRWDETDYPGRFVAVLGNGSVMLADDRLYIQNKDGKVIEEWSSVLDNFAQEAPNGQTIAMSSLVSATHERARRQALEVDKTLDALLEELS